MNLPKTNLTNDKIDEILIPMLFGEEGMAKQDGSSLMGQIVYSQNSKLSKSREKITTLIHQAEIKARIDELVKVNYFIVKHSSSLLLPPPSDIKNNINERISALEKEIVNE